MIDNRIPPAEHPDWFHGGVVGLKPGDLIVCPYLLARRGKLKRPLHREADPDCRDFHVYITSNLDLAIFYGCPGGGSWDDGAVYRVTPYGPIEHDPENNPYQFRCIHAHVRQVVVPVVTPDVGLEAGERFRRACVEEYSLDEILDGKAYRVGNPSWAVLTKISRMIAGCLEHGDGNGAERLSALRESLSACPDRRE